jgi:hypothetical protein
MLLPAAWGNAPAAALVATPVPGGTVAPMVDVAPVSPVGAGAPAVVAAGSWAAVVTDAAVPVVRAGAGDAGDGASAGFGAVYG